MGKVAAAALEATAAPAAKPSRAVPRNMRTDNDDDTMRTNMVSLQSSAGPLGPGTPVVRELLAV
jgi:hypothetical protein